MRPDLDHWMERPLIALVHRRDARAEAADFWRAAQSVRLSDTRALGRLIRLRIPGIPEQITFDEMFRSPPFNVLYADDGALVSGLVGRIWTLRRDYPTLEDPEDFRDWQVRGTVRVLFATWVEPGEDGTSAVVNEARVDPVDRRGRIGLSAVRPLITASHNLVGSDGLDVAVRRAQRSRGEVRRPNTGEGATR